MADKQIEITDYGIYVLSPEKLSKFFSDKKIRTKKVLNYFQKHHEVYLESLENGIWLPILPIDSIEYIVKIKGVTDPFNEEWKELIKYDGFNLEVGEDNSFWIGSFGDLLNWDKNTYLDPSNETISYTTLDGEELHSAFKFNIEKGKYLVSIKGYRRTKDAEYPEANYGYFFEFEKVEDFDGYKDPREDEKYKFNLTEQ